MLVVEDSEVVRRVMALVFESEGYEVFECSDGQRVLELARHCDPDLITLDLALPDVEGREILSLLASDESLRGVPVVVVSAFADCLTPFDRKRAADVILKPFDLDDLLIRVRHAIATRPDRSGLNRPADPNDCNEGD